MKANISFTRHIIAWSLFMLYEMGTVYFAVGVHGYILTTLLFYVLNICLFYINAHILLPWVFNRLKKPYFTAILLVIIEILIYIIIKYGLDNLLVGLLALHHPAYSFDKYVIINVWRGLFFIGISTLYWSVLRMVNFQRISIEAENRYYYSLVEKAKLEQELTEAQNAYLQQQINPHFLFNTLNLIYNSFYPFSAPAAACVGKLADFMRYSFEGMDKDGKAELAIEIEQIQNLIDINRLRYKFPLFIKVEITGNLANQRILPLILLSFAENIFKHGNLKVAEYPAIISISLSENNKLSFITKNLKKNWTSPLRSQHLGVSNAVKRLKNSYMNNYHLSIHDDEDTFGIELHINL